MLYIMQKVNLIFSEDNPHYKKINFEQKSLAATISATGSSKKILFQGYILYLQKYLTIKILFTSVILINNLNGFNPSSILSRPPREKYYFADPDPVSEKARIWIQFSGEGIVRIRLTSKPSDQQSLTSELKKNIF